MLKFIADVCGAGAALWALLRMLAAVVGLGSATLSSVTTPVALAGLVGLTVTTLLVGFVVRHLALALLVVLQRGTAALDWCRPAECTDFGSWCAHSWDFFGKGGRHQGVRCFGLELALKGNLGNQPESDSDCEPAAG
jgi:hypothetical protein